MARSFSSVKKLISAFGVNEASVITLNKRSFASTAKGVIPSKAVATGGKGNKVVTPKATEEVSSMWVPDPVTGYYRPENQAIQVDAAELRKRLLKKRLTTSV